MVADLVKLGYLRPDRLTLDPTFEGGVWWQKWQPNDGMLITHHRPTDGSDFRALPYGDNHFPQIAYDPPYAAMGGQETSTIAKYNERYGRDTIDASPAATQRLINDGLTEMWRIGSDIVLVKCMDYVYNGELWLGTHWTLTHAIALGFTVEEELRHYDTVAGAQPKLGICLHCTKPILRKATGEWHDRVRSVATSAFCRDDRGMPGPVAHVPDPDAKTQDHAAYSCLSTCFVLRKPRRGRRSEQYKSFAPPTDVVPSDRLF